MHPAMTMPKSVLVEAMDILEAALESTVKK
jgi:hypothetical protein